MANRSRRWKRLAWGVAALCIAALAAGVVADLRAFDRTRGGYEPPYTDFTGTPIDWSSVETTARGMRRRGYVVDVEVDCITGMIHFDAFGLRFPFRELSPRALAVHRPREACVERGFEPQFGDLVSPMLERTRAAVRPGRARSACSCPCRHARADSRQTRRWPLWAEDVWTMLERDRGVVGAGAFRVRAGPVQETVYRYRPLDEWLESILLENALYFATPERATCPFDCRFELSLNDLVQGFRTFVADRAG